MTSSESGDYLKRMFMILISLISVLTLLGACESLEVSDQADTDNDSVEIEDSEGTDLEDDMIDSQEVEAVYRLISPEEAYEMMTDDVIILDVRTQGEYDEGHIENAILLPVDHIQDGKLDLLPDMNQTILVYCRSGNRSCTASRALVEAGYTGVYDFGGIIDWPYDIVK